MKAKALTIHWHMDNQPIYSAHFQPIQKKYPHLNPGGNSSTNNLGSMTWRRLATGGGDNTVRIWGIGYNKDTSTEDFSTVTYLSTLSRHTQAVNAVRFDPKGSVLASAGDDGSILLWVMDEPSQNAKLPSGPVFGEDEDSVKDRETWKLRHACRASTSSSFEVYDIAWSPDSQYIIAGSMDNIARIYNANNGQCVRQLAEHSHYVQGVAWDPLNEYIATQSSDRSLHIYALKTKDGQFSLSNHHKISKIELPTKRIAATVASAGSPSSAASSMDQVNSTGATSMANRVSSSPASQQAFVQHHHRHDSSDHNTTPALSALSPASHNIPSTPGTPMSMSTMNPPPPVSRTHSRKSSFSSVARSESPSPAIPLPAVRQIGSPNINSVTSNPSGASSVASPSPSFYFTMSRGTMGYHNESFTSFFRRLTFSPDGSLLFTPSGLFKYNNSALSEESTNTVYIYTRAGLNRPPLAHLPGLKKPSLAVVTCPVLFKLRESKKAPISTKHVVIDMTHEDQPKMTTTTPESTKGVDSGMNGPVFKLNYRMMYAVATQDSVIVYDTQQTTPLCIISNLHYATFTDLTWSPDGQLLFMTSTDGFCSVIKFEDEELGEPYTPPPPPASASANTFQPPPAPSPVMHPTTSHAPVQPISLSAASSPAASAIDSSQPGLIPVLSHVPSLHASSSHPNTSHPNSTAVILSASPPESVQLKRPLSEDKSSEALPSQIQGHHHLSISPPLPQPQPQASTGATAGILDEAQKKKRRIVPTLLATESSPGQLEPAAAKQEKQEKQEVDNTNSSSS